MTRLRFVLLAVLMAAISPGPTFVSTLHGADVEFYSGVVPARLPIRPGPGCRRQQ